MARMNISIPDDLKNRMDKHASVNWSQTASEAFQEKINSIESTMKVNNMTDAIARLHASKENYGSSQKQEGYQHGFRWASQKAEYIELKRLDDALDKWGEEAFMDCEAIEKTATNEAYDLNIFEDEVVESYEYAQGFVDGAMHVFSQVD